MTRASLAALTLVFATGVPTTVFAQATENKEAPKKEEPAKDPKTVAYEAAVKELKRVEGAMPLYLRKKEILLEVPEDKLGKLFFVQATLNTGVDAAFMHAGMPVGGNAVDVFRWDRNEDQLWLVRPNVANRWEKDDAYAKGAERTFPEGVLGSFRIEQQDPARKVLLVNVTQLFYGDLFRLPEMVMSGLQGPYQLDREKSGVEKAKGYPENTVVGMKMYFFSPRGSQMSPLLAALGFGDPNTLEDDRSAPLRVTYSLSYRKDDGYVPRIADPRVGYFTQDFFSVNRFLSTDRTERYINRWHLQKKDPKAKLSEPVKPIVWTIDPSIPEIYRPAVKEGILRWNKAFEAQGYKNAIVVQDAPKGDDYDHADGRYNVVRMLVGPSSPFAAISLFRTDPLSGQILNASITLDANMIRDIQEEHRSNQHTLGTAHQRGLEVMRRDVSRKESDEFHVFATPEERARKVVNETMRSNGWASHLCSHGSELKREADLQWFSLKAGGGPLSKEEYVKRFLSDCVSHELGHGLGLRHNFAGSTNLTTAQLADDTITTEQGISASVMDYTPVNVQAVLKGRGNFYMPTVGVYDVWAIGYGYKDFGAKTPAAERHHLAQIAKQSNAPGHAYMSDEDADGFNPYAVRFDAAKDPLNYSAKVLLSLRRAQNYAIKNLPAPGESYSKRTNVILNVLARTFKEGRNTARFVGGIATTKNFRGDAGERPTVAPIDAAMQRQAMGIIAKNFFGPEAFALPEPVLKSLSFDENRGSWGAPLRDILSGQQASLLSMLMAASTTDRIAENSYKSKASYGLVEHYDRITGAVFAELGKDQDVSTLRRDLQRFALSGLMAQAGAPQGAINEDVKMIAGEQLRRLNQRMLTQLKSKKKIDPLTRIHFRDSQQSIERFLDREIATTR